MKGLKILFSILSSRSLLVLLVAGWVILYVTVAIFLKEAFATFIGGLKDNPLIYVPYMIFLASGYANLIRVVVVSVIPLKYRLLRIFFPLGVMVFLTGFFVSIQLRQFDWIITGEGDVIRTRWDGQEYLISKVRSGIKERFLDIEEEGGVLAYEPRAIVVDRSSRQVEIGAFPPGRFNGNYFHILNFGIAPHFVLFEGDKVITEGYVPMRLIPVGSSDFFDIPSYPYRFTLSISPERLFDKGKIRVAEYNLKNPRFRIRITRGETVIAEGEGVREISFHNLRIVFNDSIPWIMLEAVNDPGLPVMVAGIFITLSGLPLWLISLFMTGRKQKELSIS